MRMPGKKTYFILCVFLFMPAHGQDEILECVNQGEKWCYQEIANKPGCFLLVEKYSSKSTFIWSGACKNGLAHGQGTGTWKKFIRVNTSFSWGADKITYSKGKLTTEGERGGFNNEEVYEEAVYEGFYTEGKTAGVWVLKYKGGGVFEGPYIDGKRNGQWVARYKDGDVHEGPYVDGARNGRWVLRKAEGSVFEGPYVNNKQNGRWVVRDAKGGVQRGSVEDGRRIGKWIERSPDGTVAEGSYSSIFGESERDGEWVVKKPDGSRICMRFSNGRRFRQPRRC